MSCSGCERRFPECVTSTLVSVYIYYWYVPCLVADVKGDFLNVLRQPWFLYIHITGMYHVL